MTERSHRHALETGYQLHWYKIESVLGQGGFGITYLARDTNLDRLVAIKEYLPSDFAIRDGDFSVHPLSGNTQPQFEWGLDRFISEAKILSKFEHPNIVRIFAVFEENNTGYLIMPYEKGSSLQTLLKGKKTLDQSRLLKIIEPILDGLEMVHKHEFIHRDIKPDNIFIREDGSPVLLDFGSARQAVTGQVKTLTTLVSPGYAPFEQYYSKSDEQGPWTDIYGLGATIYRAITGRPPLDAVDRSKSLLDGSQDTFQSAMEIGAGHYSAEFLHAIDHAISFKPIDRPQSISEWRREFDFNQENIATEISDRRENMTTEPRDRPTTKNNNGYKKVVSVFLILMMLAVIVFYLTIINKDIISPQESGANVPQENTEMLELAVENEMPVQVIEEIPQEIDEHDERAVNEELLAAQQALEQERLALEQERNKMKEELLRQEEKARLAEIEKQKQQKEQKRFDEEKRLAEEQQVVKEKQRQEEMRLAEVAKQKRIEEQRILEEEQRIAEEQRVEEEQQIEEEQQEEAKQEEIENRISISRADFEQRYANKKDALSFVDNVSAQDLNQISSRKVDITVSSKIESWQNSGVEIKRGQTYKILASGQWQMSPLCPLTGPTGDDLYTITCWDVGNQTVDKRSHAALIGKIGKNALGFYIGSEFTFTAEIDGILYLACNDAPGFFFDNEGRLNIIISLEE